MSSDPRNRPMDKQAVAEGLANYLRPTIIAAFEDATKTCLTCDHFKEHKGEICGKYNQRPPARVIAFGCPAYENEIPF